MNLVLVVPSYNSNDTLTQLINSINIANDVDIIIVDDDSDDIFTTDLSNVEVLRNKKNMGKGFSLRKAFKHAIDRSFTHAVTLDADLQHSPSELYKFIDESEEFDFILGCRDRDRSMPLHRKFSNFITTFIISKLSGFSVLDSQCGYRRYNLKEVGLYKYKEDGFQFESEVLIKCLKSTSKVKQVKIETIYDKDNKSYINHVSDTLKFIRLILRSIFK